MLMPTTTMAKWTHLLWSLCFPSCQLLCCPSSCELICCPSSCQLLQRSCCPCCQLLLHQSLCQHLWSLWTQDSWQEVC